MTTTYYFKETDDINVIHSSNLPPKDDLTPVGYLYLGMGYYLCIYRKDDKYTYWILGGSNGYDAAENNKIFYECTQYILLPWEDLVNDIKSKYVFAEEK
jgi:hypothetical protein